MADEELAEVLRLFQKRLKDPAAELPDAQTPVDFGNTYFRNPLGFLKYVVTGTADFRSATFTGIANFRSAILEGQAEFSSAEFKSTTDFEEAQFRKFVPAFHAAKLYDHTKFTLQDNHREHWPPIQAPTEIDSDELEYANLGLSDEKKYTKQTYAEKLAKDQKDAYNRLRLFMNQSLQTESEQFFHRREMACKKVLDGDFMYWVYLFYEVFSDYGYSVKRPTLLLLGNLVLGWAVILCWQAFQPPLCSWEKVLEAVGLSFSNVFPFFFGLGGRFVPSNFYTGMPLAMKMFSSLQTVTGFISLFLFGLGLRSRFRLR